MLTKQDKKDLVDLSKHLIGLTADCHMCRHEIVSATCSKTIRFLVDHPDMCASEMDDYYLYLKSLALNNDVEKLKELYDL